MCRLLFLCPLLLAGCAKTGDPHPPIVLVPKPAADLVARQYSDQVLLTVSMPVQNTNGSPVTSLAEIVVLRRVETDRTNNAPLSESDFLKEATPIQTINSAQVRDYLHDKTLVFRDDLAFPDRSIVYGDAFRYAVRFTNRKKQSAGLGNQAFIAPVPLPPPPVGLTAEVTQQFVRLRWKTPTENMDGSRPPRVAGYNLYRSEDPKKSSPVPLNAELLRETEFDDGTFQFDKTFYYAVSVVASRESPYAESLASQLLAVTPRDTFPPGAPQNLNVVASGGVVLLLWAAPADTDVAGYRIYRKEEGSAGFQPLETDQVSGLSYRDEKIRAGTKYEYRVTAIDTHGNEGPAAQTAVEVP